MKKVAATLITLGLSTAFAQNVTGKIDFWVYQPEHGAMGVLTGLKAEFEKLHPGTTINIVPVPKDDFNTKINTAIAAGNAPDASYLDQPLVARFASDKLLDAMPAKLINKADYYRGALNTNLVGSKLYGLPLSQTTVALYYNKDLVPNPPKTWNELLAVAKKVYDPQKKIAAFAVPRGDGWGAWLFPGFVATAGGKMLDAKTKTVSFGEQPAIDALNLWKDLLSYSPRMITDSQNAFQTGRVAMMISGPWELNGLRTNWPKLNFGVALIPKGKANGSNIGGDNAVVYAKAKNKALAWEWLKFITQPEQNTKLATQVMGNFPINVKTAQGDWLKGDKELAVFIQQMKTAQARPTVKDWIKVNDEIVAKALEEALDGGSSAEKALKDAASKAKTVLGW